MTEIYGSHIYFGKMLRVCLICFAFAVIPNPSNISIWSDFVSRIADIWVLHKFAGVFKTNLIQYRKKRTNTWNTSWNQGTQNMESLYQKSFRRSQNGTTNREMLKIVMVECFGETIVDYHKIICLTIQGSSNPCKIKRTHMRKPDPNTNMRKYTNKYVKINRNGRRNSSQIYIAQENNLHKE